MNGFKCRLIGRVRERSPLRLEILEPRMLLSAVPVSPGPGLPAPVPLVSPSQESLLTPQQMRAAYGINLIMEGSVVGNGQGQTIAIVDAYDDPSLVSSTAAGFSTSDLAQFDAYWTANGYSIPNPPSFRKLDQNGGTNYPTTDPTGDWEVEEALDVEWAHVIAPNANIVLIEADDDSLANLMTAVNTARNLKGVSVVSMSWGEGEFSGENEYDASFTTPAGHNGVTFVVASGDDGTVNYPACSPNVLAVGGTVLIADPSGSYESEIGWSGSGGGPSLYETEPAYQLGVQQSGWRETPDVAFDAGTPVGVYDTCPYEGTSYTWWGVEGTSLAAPCWAALIATADQLRASRGFGSLDGLSQTLPALYALPASDFHDITQGANAEYSAGPGYDMVTGIGSPVANTLAPDLANYGIPASGLQLVFTTEPANTVGGQTLAAVMVTIEDQNGNVQTTDKSSVSLLLSSGTLGGTTSAAAVHGVATFSNLSVTTEGAYTLIASDSADNLSGFASTGFNISAAPAWKLAFSTEPENGVAGQTLAAVEVAVEDKYGNVETGDASVVRLSPSSGTMGGTLTEQAVNGVATFSDLSIPAAGEYTLTATDTQDSLPAVASASFAVKSAPSYSFQTVAALDGTGGSWPYGRLLMDGSGDIYGTASGGGDANNDGTVFEIKAGTGTITTVATFDGSNGSEPYGGVVMDAAGNLYGTTFSGGEYGDGVLYEIAKGSGAITALASFDGDNGSGPGGELLLEAGNLYGTTVYGGASVYGTVFEYQLSSYTLSTLASFDGSNGAYPVAGLIMDGSGNLYGTASQWGLYGVGTVFEVKANSGTITTLASFNGANGAYPYSTLVLDGSGNLYGTACYGGAYGGQDGGSGYGTVFEVAAGSNTITPLVSFNGSNGEWPCAGLVMDARGDLFGTAECGGPDSDGNVFEIVAGTNIVTPIASFHLYDGAYPEAALIMDGSGNLYGTASSGGDANSDGAVFELSPNATAAKLAFFPQPGDTVAGATIPPITVDVENAHGNLVSTDNSDVTLRISSGTLSGTLTEQAVNGVATFSDLSIPAAGEYTLTATDTQDSLPTATSASFAVKPAPSYSFKTVAALDGTDGSWPYGRLLMDGSGDIYGTASGGGDANNDGTVFEIKAGTGRITTVATFDGTDGSEPYGGLVMDAAGNLYGTTFSGGEYGDGVLFEIAKGSGAITTLASFDDTNGAGPGGELLLHTGNLYGTTLYGGDYDCGTVFAYELSSGMLTTVASFDGSNGAIPAAGLVMDGSGNLYGTAFSGGEYGAGTVFEVAANSGTITTLASFNGPNGACPCSTLVLDGSGNLYGTAYYGGAYGYQNGGSGYGTVFEVAAGSNTITTLVSFNGSNGECPYAGLVTDARGDLFGTTTAGDAGGDGNVFEIVAGTNTLFPLVNFNGTDGSSPAAGLIMDGKQEDLYGITTSGGANDDGVVFELSLALKLDFVLQPGNTVAGAPISAVTVEVEDTNGNLISTDNSDVTLAIGTGPAGGTLSGAMTEQVVNGVATFGDLSITQAGTYTLTASDSADGLSGGLSNSFTISPAAASQLVFTTQPTTSVAGQALSSVQVTVEDRYGNVETGDNSTVVSLSDASGTLGGTTSAKVQNGVAAAFGNLTITKAGSDHLYAADSADGLSGFASKSFTISPAAASQLAFTTQPTNGVAGQALFSVRVAVEDQYGNVETGDNSTSVSLTDGSGTLGGTTSLAATDGVATFSNLSIIKAGTDYLYAADSADGLSGFTSNSFTISPAAASQLVFTTEPASGVAGKNLSPVTVTIEDPYGNVETGDNWTIVGLSDDTDTLSGTTAEPASSGVATFSSLSVTKAGSDHLYAADSADGLINFPSNSFTISPAAAAQLAFTKQPGNALAGSTITAAVTVEDAYGNVVTSDSSNVTLALDSGTLNGILTEQAASGVATFSYLSVPAASAGIHTLTATDDSLTPGTSTDFGVTAFGLAGDWQLAGVLSHGLFITDGQGDVVGGSIQNNDGTSLTLTGGSYAVNRQGVLTMTCEDASGWTYTWAGSVNAAHDAITAAETPLQAITNEAVMVLSAGSFSDASLSGSWAFEQANGTYGSLTLDGKGDVTGGNWASQTNGTSGGILSGSNYTVSADGLVTMTLYVPNKSSSGGTETLVWSGALNSSEDLLAGDEAVNSGDLSNPTLVTVTKHAGTFALFDLSGAWNITSNEMAGSVLFNGAGKILPSSYSDPNGTFSMSGTYTISPTGQVTANVTTNEPGNTTLKLTGYLDSAMDSLAMDQVINNSSDRNVFSILTTPSPTDLVASVAGGTLLNLNPTIPADRGSVSVVVTNDGQIPAGGSATVALYLCTSNGETTGGTLLGQLTNQPLSLAYGQSKTYALSTIQLPANLAYGTYYLRADVSATLRNPAENPQGFSASSPAVPVAWEFGNVGARKGVVLNLTEPDGTVVTFSLSGAGMGDVTVAGDEWDLDVTGSTTASSVTITTRKSATSSSGQISLDDITVEGPLASFSGSGVNLTGAMNVSGSIGALTLNNLSDDGGIDLGGAATGKTTLTFNQVEDESLTCSNTIGSLTAACWEDADSDGTDSISAPGLGTATIKKGDLAASLNIGAGGMGSLTISGGSLSGDVADAGALTTLTVKGGGVSGNISAATVGTVSVSAGSLLGSITDAGGLTSLTVTGGGISGNVSAMREGTISVTGGAVSGDIASTATAAQLGAQTGIGTLTVSGGNLIGNVMSNGNVGAVSVTRSTVSGLGGSVSGALTLGGGLSSLTVSGGSISGDITAATIGTISLSGGSLIGGITDAGGLTTLRVTGGSIQGAISAATIGTMSVSGGSLLGGITDAGGLTSLTVTGGGISGNISARREGTISVTGGDVSGDISSTGTAAQLGTQTGIGTLTVSGGNLIGNVVSNGNVGAVSVTRNASSGLGGNVSGAFTLGGGLSSLTLTGGNLSGSLVVSGGLGSLSLITAGGNGGNVLGGASVKAGTIGTLSVGGSFDGVSGNGIAVNAAAITTLSVSGDMDYTALALSSPSPAANAPALGALSVRGTMDYSQLLADGNIGAVTLGAMDNSAAYAGVNLSNLTEQNGLWGLPSALADFSGQDNIGSFTIVGLKSNTAPMESLINSNIAAWKLGTVSLAYAQGSNNGVPFGVACS